jgi:SulP family sulfate permease
MVLVSAVTVATDLAIAVVVGVIVSALVFAWNTARSIYVEASAESTDERRVYTLHGQLFFASITGFRDLFNPVNDPHEVVIDFRHSRIWDHSGLEAIVDLARRYERAGRELHLLHLPPSSLQMLGKANLIIDVDPDSDPSYKVTASGLGGSGEGH